MASDVIDISDAFTWDEGLPRPQWDLVDSWVEARVDPQDWGEAWSSIGKQWLEALGHELGVDYRVLESADCLLLAASPELESLLSFAGQCQRTLPAALPGVADFQFAGKQIVLSLKNNDDYYRYLSAYYPEGHHGGSGGIHVREGYPHIALNGHDLASLENALAHEMTHASLCHLALPLWIEEGLAQHFEHEIAGRSHVQVNNKMAQEQKRYWTNHGMDEFWDGGGFFKPGKVQNYCYVLAEILMHLLIDDHRPRWFGWDQGQLQRLLAFLRDANATDFGAASAEAHLGFSLGQIAERFLGPGEWQPGL